MAAENNNQLIRLGILGAARIAPSAVIKPAGQLADSVVVLAVAARDLTRARSFAAEHKIPRVHSSYEALLADPEIDAVFIPTPNSLHHKWTLKALAAGKHVLCEKPLALNETQAMEMEHVAATAGRVCAEAFHWLYHPLLPRLQELVRELGLLRSMFVDFVVDFKLYDASIRSDMHEPTPLERDIRLDSRLGGGVTMDLGCYAISTLRHLTGEEPVVLSARAERWRGDGAVDMRMDAEMQLPTSGASAGFRCSFVLAPGESAALRVTAEGEHGKIVATNYLAPHQGHRLLRWKRNGAGKLADDPEELPPVDGPFPNKRSTYLYQLAAFVEEVRRFELEDRCHGRASKCKLPSSAADAVKNMRVIDKCYTQAGLQPRL